MGVAQLVTPRVWTGRSSGRWFYMGMAAFAFAFSIAAFGPSLVNTAGRKGPTTALVAAHGVVYFAWLAIFLAQTVLVRTKRVGLHRRLGTASAFLALAVVILGYLTAVGYARRGFDMSGDLGAFGAPWRQLPFMLLDLLMFTILVSAGYAFRRHAAIHKRLMLLAVVGALMPASITHLTGHYPLLRGFPLMTLAVLVLFLASSAIYDFCAFRRIHPVSLWVALAIFAADNLCARVIAPSAAWQSVFTWIAK